MEHKQHFIQVEFKRHNSSRPTYHNYNNLFSIHLYLIVSLFLVYCNPPIYFLMISINDFMEGFKTISTSSTLSKPIFICLAMSSYLHCQRDFNLDPMDMRSYSSNFNFGFDSRSISYSSSYSNSFLGFNSRFDTTSLNSLELCFGFNSNLLYLTPCY
jgi:hypothetical protein